jgi:uncharacterized protein (DUF58 family)
VKGRGQDLYALRDYQPTDSARHVHWKASARSGSLMVREFAREEDSRVMLVFDPHSGAAEADSTEKETERFEQAVELCAAIAWDFYERGTLLQFQSGSTEVPQVPAEQNIFAVLHHLALVQPIAPAALPPLSLVPRADPGSFQIVVTSRERGSIPADVWNASYVVFAGEVAG